MDKFTSALGAALLHTLQRHRDILQDYSHEFNKTKTSAEQLRARQELLGSTKRAMSASKVVDGLQQESQHLRKSVALLIGFVGGCLSH